MPTPTKNITIPKTIEDATSALNGLGALLTAKEWERAAIVYAFTAPEASGGRPKSGGSPSLSLNISQFAALGISGLTRREDVAFYRKCWQTAIDDGQAMPVKPGDRPSVPERTWPPFHRSGTEKERVERAVRNNPKIVAEALRDNPLPVAEALQEVDPGGRFEAAIVSVPHAGGTGLTSTTGGGGTDYSADLRAAVARLIPIVHAVREGKWEPEMAERVLISFASRALAHIGAGTEVSESLFDDIKEHLQKAKTS